MIDLIDDKEDVVHSMCCHLRLLMQSKSLLQQKAQPKFAHAILVPPAAKAQPKIAHAIMAQPALVLII